MGVVSRAGRPFKFIYNLSGGINDSSQESAFTGDEAGNFNELSDSFNHALHVPNGTALTQRPGLTQHSSGTFTSGYVPYLIFQGIHDGYVCASKPATAGAIFDDDATSVDGGLTVSTTWDAVSFNGKDIFVNGTDKRVTSDGTTFAALGGTPPNFTMIEVYNNYIFGAGHDKGKLRWSELQDETSWPAVHELVLTLDEDDTITGLAKFRDALFVFTRKRYFQVTGTGLADIGVAHVAHEGPGCVANRSIVITDQGIAWWSQKGLAFSRDGFNVDLPMMRKLRLSLTALDQEFNESVFGVWEPLHERVIFWHRTTTPLYRCIVYYYNRDVFFKWQGAIATCTAAGILPGSWSQFPHVHVGGTVNSENAVFQIDGTTATDNGSSITSSIETPRISLDGSTAIGKLRDITVETMGPTNSSFTLFLYLNDTYGTYNADTDAYLGGNPNFTYTVPASTDTRRIANCSQRFRELKVGLKETGSTGFTPRRIIVRGYYVSD